MSDLDILWQRLRAASMPLCDFSSLTRAPGNKWMSKSAAKAPGFSSMTPEMVPFASDVLPNLTTKRRPKMANPDQANR